MFCPFRFLAAALAATGLLCLADAQTADDPFALLFSGEEELEVSLDARPGANALQLISMTLRGRELLDAAPAFTTKKGLCVPLEPLTDALRFPFEFNNNGQASGWFVSENRSISIDFETGELVFNGRTTNLPEGTSLLTNLGWCLTLDTLSDIFPIDFDYNERALIIEARPREILPVEAQLEREARRRELSNLPVLAQAIYRNVDNPYRWISWPAADLRLDARASSGGIVSGQYSAEAAGDLLKATARFGIQGSTEDPLQQLRFSLQRTNDKREELGTLKARRFAVGDVAAPPLPLLTNLQTGRGIHISSKHEGAANLFNATTIRGPLPENWEAELHDGEQLLAFALEPDDQGNYVFDNVVLQPGLNIFEVHLFGPFGETEIREVRYFIGSELNPENEVSYAFGFVEPNKTILGMDQNIDGRIDVPSQFDGALFDDIRDRNAEGPLLYSSLEKGINERLSIRLDAASEVSGRVSNDFGVAASAFFAWGGTYGALRLATNGKGLPAFQASLQRRLFRRTSVRANIAEYGSIENAITGRDGNRLRREGNINTSTSLLLGRRAFPVQTSLGWQHFASGLKRVRAASRIATSVARTNLSHTVRFITSTDDESTSNIANGEWLASRSIGPIRIRSGLSYEVAPDTRFRTLSVSGQSVFRSGIAQFGLQQDLIGGELQASAAWARPVGPAVLSTSAGWRRSGSWNVGVNLAFSLYKPRDRVRPALGPPGLSRAGSVRLTTYQDIDGDRVFDGDDIAIPNTQFIVQDSLRSEMAGADGSVILGGLPSGSQLNVELRTSSLDDPFLTPVELGRSVLVRPGQVIDIPFPLQSTGDVEGTVQVQNGEFLVSVSGVTVQAIDEFGQVAGETRTEFDGYVYIPELPLGTYKLRIAPDDLARVNGSASAVPFELTADLPSAFGVDMTVRIADSS
ncbi:MAG: carboxypeptidase-like regulatory domain-containing protein [Pseudomonadota bacterium]